ncbi:2EXR domain-containing protein [Fusarium sp. LHS14.1]|nr:2EXR domain-containing protein [Fusarium sp. LHS14.1]
MDLCDFHPFPRLPTELRLKIWETCLRPSQRHRPGLHYCTIGNDKRLVPLSWGKFSRLEKHGGASPDYRSACLWHAGLWAACKESRSVIMEHYQLKEWNEYLEIGPPKKSVPEYYYADGGSRREILPPSMITVREGHDESYLTVYPTRDIFCVTSDGCELAFWSGERRNINHSLYYATTTSRRLGVQNFAIEFDHSWTRFFPDKIYTLKEEKSARGYLARMLEGLAGCSFWTKLWLIDKHVRWSASPGKEVGPVFYDYDCEYVQINVSDTLPDPNSGTNESSVACFIRRLGELGDRDYTRRYMLAVDDEADPGFWASEPSPFLVKEWVRILVRRDNQVAGDIDGLIQSMSSGMVIESR